MHTTVDRTRRCCVGEDLNLLIGGASKLKRGRSVHEDIAVVVFLFNGGEINGWVENTLLPKCDARSRIVLMITKDFTDDVGHKLVCDS